MWAPPTAAPPWGRKRCGSRGSRRRCAARELEVQDLGNLSGPGNPWQPPHDGYRHLPEVVRWNELVHDAVLWAAARRGGCRFCSAAITA